MNIPLLENIRFLTSKEHILPTRHYILRNPWRLHKERVEADFLNKKGVYCFWFAANNPFVQDKSLETSYLGAEYSPRPRLHLDHSLTPLYVGMTALAAYTKGGLLLGRIVDRLNRFPKVFQEYKINNRFVLSKRKNGTCGSFDLFKFPERIARDLSVKLHKAVTTEDAELELINHPDIIKKYAKEYKDIFITPIHSHSCRFMTKQKCFTPKPWPSGFSVPG